MKTCPGQVPIGPNLVTHKRKFGIGFTQIMTSIKIEELFPQVEHIRFIIIYSRRERGGRSAIFSLGLLLNFNLWLKLFF